MVLRTPLVRQLDLLFKLVSMDTIRCWLWAEYLLLSLPFGNIHSFVWWGCILSYSRVDLVYQYPSDCQVSACIFETKSLTHIFCCRVVWYLLLPSIYLFSSWMISPITLDIDLQIIQFNETCGLTDLYGGASPSLGTAYHVSGYQPFSCCRVLSDHVSLIYLPTYNTLLDKVVPSSHGSIYVLTLLGILILCYVSNLLAWDVKQRCFRSRRSTLA